MDRLHYLDNLRWICILLLFPTHAAFVFCAGWYGYYVLSSYPSVAAHCLAVAVEPWIMVLLFCIAGMSTRYALMKRSSAGYLKERVTRLLVPFLAGVVFVCPVIAYYAMKYNTGYTGNFLGAFAHFFTSLAAFPDLNGMNGDFSIDHLWFILFLFLFSIAGICLISAGRRLARIRIDPATTGLPALVLFFVVIWILNFAGPLVSGYSIVGFFAAFLAGYCVVWTAPVQAVLERYWRELLAAWIALTIGVMWGWGIFFGHIEVFWGTSPLYVLTGWTGALAVLGAGKHWLDFSTPSTKYLTAASYPVYIIHQAFVVAAAYYLVMLAIPAAVQYAAIVATSLGATFACYEILRRIPGVRVLFGIAGNGRQPVESPGPER